MNDDYNFGMIVNSILQDYRNTFNAPEIPIKYIVTDNMPNEYAKLRPDHAQSNPEQIATLDSYNGNTVPPDSVKGQFTVLLNKKFLKQYVADKNYTWVGTIVHETTHVIDFTKYAKIIEADNYEDIIRIDKNAMFQLWTEFNARAKGYYFVRKYTFADIHDEVQVKDIIEIELPAQTKILQQNYYSTQSWFQQAYLISHYLGRLYTLTQIFPNHFDEEQVMRILDFNEWMYDWFVFLYNHPKLEEAYKDFDIMRDILRQNFKDL